MRGVWFFVAAGSALVIASRLLGDMTAAGAAIAVPSSQERPLVKEHPLRARRLSSRIKKKELLIAWV